VVWALLVDKSGLVHIVGSVEEVEIFLKLAEVGSYVFNSDHVVILFNDLASLRHAEVGDDFLRVNDSSEVEVDLLFVTELAELLFRLSELSALLPLHEHFAEPGMEFTLTLASMVLREVGHRKSEVEPSSLDLHRLDQVSLNYGFLAGEHVSDVEL